MLVGAGNPELKPERGEEIAVGFDSRAWNDRLQLNATWYRDVTRDALIERPAYDPLIAAAQAAGANVVHFERSVGQQVKVKTAEPVEGRRVHEGALVSADPEAIVIASEGGELRVRYEDIDSARTVFEWGRARSRT